MTQPPCETNIADVCYQMSANKRCYCLLNGLNTETGNNLDKTQEKLKYCGVQNTQMLCLFSKPQQCVLYISLVVHKLMLF